MMLQRVSIPIWFLSANTLEEAMYHLPKKKGFIMYNGNKRIVGLQCQGPNDS
jgi:hypothetical protein